MKVHLVKDGSKREPGSVLVVDKIIDVKVITKK